MYRELAVQAAIALGLATIFALFGIVGTGELGWPVVWLYWAGLLLASLIFALAIVAQVERHWLLGRPWVLRWIVSSLMIAAPMTALVAMANRLVGLPEQGHAYLAMAGWVLVITLLVVGVYLALNRLRPASMLQPPPPVLTPAAPQPVVAIIPELAPSSAPGAFAEVRTPQLLRRLSPRLAGAEVWALQAEDHYVRVHSGAGSELMLMRLEDAIAEMEPVEGARIHRSWWVSRTAAAIAKRRGDAAVIVLPNGLEAPVSRRRLAELRTAGWL